MVPCGQTLPQVPQLLESLVGLTQALLQLICSGGHWRTHIPPVHTWFAAQAMPHAPQFMGSVFRSTQAPLQLVLGAVQTPHVPSLHT
jgi:hypothetical protein